MAVMISIQDDKAHTALKRDRLRAELQRGLKQFARGKQTEGQAFMRTLIEELKE